MNTNTLPIHPYGKAFQMAKDYFLHSDHRLKAWLLLIGAVVSIVASVALVSAIAWWLTGFYAALTAMNLPLFIGSMKLFTLITGAWIAVSALKDYCVENLRMSWRSWLMEKLIPKYTGGKINYLDLHRHPEQIDNPEQRIQEDTKSFVDNTISLTLDLLNSTLTLISFSGSLWVIGGSLSFVLLGVGITIPGYMFWAAFLFAGLASFITHKIGQKLDSLNQKEETLEADVRKELFTLNKDAESIAQLQGGKKYHQPSLLGKFREICSNWGQKILIQLGLTSFKSFYEQVASIFPYLMAAPAYFSGLIPLAQIMQVGFVFSQVQFALSWFINSYETLAKYKASTTRLMELENALDGGLTTSERNIVLREDPSRADIQISNLNIDKPQKEASDSPSSTNLILSQLNMTLHKGDNTVIQGANGLGKSTMFKAIAGTWNYGSGEITMPSREQCYVVPQKPVMIHDTLRALLAYPDPVETFTDGQYRDALNAVKFKRKKQDEFIAKLEVEEEQSMKEDWSTLSGGEQQKIEFARAVLRKPEYLLLDEATAAMDEESENHIYNLRNSVLRGTTFYSIAHRNVLQHHDRVQILEVDESQKVQVQEVQLRASANDEETADAIWCCPS